MHTNDLRRSLPALLGELAFGAPESGAFVLNPGDPGLLASLDRIPAAAASASDQNRASVAAHAEHLRYGLSLLNRWAGGENPFADADWSISWQRGVVTEEQWAHVRDELRRELEEWHTTLGLDREVSGPELDGVIGSIVHLAYHMGSMRQIEPALGGPKATDR